MTTPRPSWTSDWSAVCAARLPVAGLAALAPLRSDGEVRILLEPEIAWARWPAKREDVIRCLLPVTGAEFYQRRGESWYRFGSRLPTSAVPPPGIDRPIASVLVPSRFSISSGNAESRTPIVLRIVRGGEPQPVSALACLIQDLAAWASTATTRELANVRGACKREQAVLLGARLPSIPGGKRFWGESVLAPLGFRVEPDLSQTAVLEAVGASQDEMVIFHEDGVEILPRSAFEPLSRARVRLAIQRTSPRERSP